jgi:pimeloyl-ACP methyl ester carboxylesterase
VHGTERINGVDLFVRRFGDPALPTLVIVHGGPGWDHSYLLPAAELRDIRHVVFFDLRGCGRSTREADLQPDLIADDVAALIGAGRRADVLGHSYGGGVAMRVADQHPERVRSVILSSTTAFPEMAAVVPAERAGRALDWADPVWRREDGALARAMAHADVGKTIWRLDRADDWRRVLDGVRFSSAWDRPYLEGRLKPARPPDPVRALTGRPVLLVHGEHDMTFPLAAAVRLRAALPGSSLRVVAEDGHMPQFDNPGEWLAAIRGFLARR